MKVRPVIAITKGAARYGPGIIVLPAAHEMHDFEGIALGHRALAQLAARGNHAVMLDRHLGRVKFELAHEVGDGGSGGAAGFAIDGQADHAARLSLRSAPCKRRSDNDAG